MFNSTRDPEELFQRQERIGKGSFGEVYKGINLETNETVAIKVIDLEGMFCSIFGEGVCL